MTQVTIPYGSLLKLKLTDVGFFSSKFKLEFELSEVFVYRRLRWPLCPAVVKHDVSSGFRIQTYEMALCQEDSLKFEEMIRSILSTSLKRTIQFWTHLQMMTRGNISYFPTLGNLRMLKFKGTLTKLCNVDEFMYCQRLKKSIYNHTRYSYFYPFILIFHKNVRLYATVICNSPKKKPYNVV